MAKYVHFFILDSTKLEATCRLCPTNTVIKYSTSSKTNLKTHHRHMTGEQKAAAVGSLPISSAFQGIPTYTNQEKVTSAVTDMIIDLNLPVSIVDRQSFRKVLATASCGRWRPVCVKTIRARIIELGSKWSFDYSEYKLKFAKPSTTLDIWTSTASCCLDDPCSSCFFSPSGARFFSCWPYLLLQKNFYERRFALCTSESKVQLY